LEYLSLIKTNLDSSFIGVLKAAVDREPLCASSIKMAPQPRRGFITGLFLQLGEIAVIIEFVDLAWDEFRLEV
jgi:hypothetical protein